MGRNSKLSTATAATATTLAKLGFTDQKLSAALGISRSTLSEWKRTDETFSKQLKEAKSVADAKVIDSLFQRAIGFYDPSGLYHPPHTTACIFWLKCRQANEWRDIQRTELSGVDGQPIQTAAPLVKLSDEHEQALQRVIADAQQRVKLSASKS